MRRAKAKYVIGVDEVGRGPIAGPVAVGAFVFLDEKAKKIFRGAKESKQLREGEREMWFQNILNAKKAGSIDFHVSFESEKVIDNKGLSFALKRALASSLKKLKIIPKDAEVLLDGGLHAPLIFINQKTIVRGDEKILVIALASICAKVLRDRRLRVLGNKHPSYGFEKHKGYGTLAHYRAIRTHGILDCHRTSFLTEVIVGQKNQ